MTSLLKSHKVAGLILSYADYESLELTLAVHAKLIEENDELRDFKLFILQNGRGTYDCEQTYQVALRYQNLYPKQIKVNDYIKSGIPYWSIKELLNSEEFSEYNYIIKLDDDVFPLTGDWAVELAKSYFEAKEKFGDQVAYSTGLVNNNPYGFKKILEIYDKQYEFKEKYARDHVVGIRAEDPYSPLKILSKGEISIGGGGTIWRYPYLARWIHSLTTMQPDEYIEKTKKRGTDVIDVSERYSINCIFFEKEFWNKIGDGGGDDDELMVQKYCIKNNKVGIANLSVPMCHLFFYTQRKENKDLLPKFREVYENWCALNYPISVIKNKEDAIEDRLRYLEQKFQVKEMKKSVISRLKTKLLKMISFKR